MAVPLVNLPLPWVAVPSLVDYGGDQTSSLGAQQSRFVRIGSRWAVKFSSLPDLAWTDAQAFLAARMGALATGSTVICPWPQLPFTAPIGAPVVDGAGQGGNTLLVSGFTDSLATLVPGLWFSILVSGRNYLYQVTDTPSVSAAGVATLEIAPWIRTAPNGGEALNFAAPQIEGFIDAVGVDWTLTMQSWVTLPAFTITEIQ